VIRGRDVSLGIQGVTQTRLKGDAVSQGRQLLHSGLWL